MNLRFIDYFCHFIQYILSWPLIVSLHQIYYYEESQINTAMLFVICCYLCRRVAFGKGSTSRVVPRYFWRKMDQILGFVQTG